MLPRPLPIVLALAAALTVAPTAAAEQRTLQLLSDRLELNPPDQSQYLAGVSDDGSRVFLDTNGQLLPSDTDSAGDVYERSATGVLTHISDTPGGPDGDNFVSLYDVSADGAVTTLSTRERLLSSDADDVIDLYSRIAGVLFHVTDDPNGPDGNDPAYFLAAAPDGATVLFVTDESLAATDTDFAQDVYRRRLGGPTIHLSDTVIAADANAAAVPVGTTDDAERIAFRTSESLAATDTDDETDVYELRPGGELTHVTRDPMGTEDAYPAHVAGVSGDGSRVFVATQEPMAPTDLDHAIDLYERDGDGDLRHISDNPTGGDAASDVVFQGASHDGRRVLFATAESLAAGDTDSNADVYERAPGGELVVVSDRTDGPDPSADAYVSTASRDGTRVYISSAGGLVAADTDYGADVYLSTVDATGNRSRPARVRFKAR